VNPTWSGGQDKIGVRAMKIKTRSPSCGRDQAQIESELS
jgi:uncharacterized protein YbbK (DUF523 family)